MEVENSKVKTLKFIKDVKNTKVNKTSLFLYDLKYAVMHNKFIRYFTLAGFTAAVIDTLMRSNLLWIIEWGGQIAGGFAITNAMRGNEPIQYKSMPEIHKHLAKSVGLVIGGLLVGTASTMIPYGHIVQYIGSTILFAGIGGIFEGGIEKYRRTHPQ